MQGFAKSRRHCGSGHRCADRTHHRGRQPRPALVTRLQGARPCHPRRPLLGSALVQALALARLLGRVRPAPDESRAMRAASRTPGGTIARRRRKSSTDSVRFTGRWRFMSASVCALDRLLPRGSRLLLPGSGDAGGARAQSTLTVRAALAELSRTEPTRPAGQSAACRLHHTSAEALSHDRLHHPPHAVHGPDLVRHHAGVLRRRAVCARRTGRAGDRAALGSRHRAPPRASPARQRRFRRTRPGTAAPPRSTP